MPFEREDIIKINGITLYAKNDDWGQSGKQSNNQVLLTDESSQQQTDCQLDAIDYHIEAYYLGEDYKNVIAKLYRVYKQQKNMLLEHNDIGRVWVKFATGGYRVRKSSNKLWYREFILNLVQAKSADLKIQVVEVQQLAKEQLNAATDPALMAILEKFNHDFSVDKITSLVKNQTVNNLLAIGETIAGYRADNLLGSIVNPFTGTFEALVATKDGIGGMLQSYLSRKKSNKFAAESSVAAEESKKYYQSYIDIAAKAGENINFADSEPETQQNTQAIIDLVKQTAIINACDCVTDSPFETKKEIEKAIENLENLSDEIIKGSEDDKALQNKIYHIVNQAIVILQEQPVCKARQIQTNISLPAVVICHQEECNEAAFVKNNQIRHPLFVPAGVSLEVADD